MDIDEELEELEEGPEAKVIDSLVARRRDRE